MYMYMYIAVIKIIQRIYLYIINCNINDFSKIKDYINLYKVDDPVINCNLYKNCIHKCLLFFFAFSYLLYILCNML